MTNILHCLINSSFLVEDLNSAFVQQFFKNVARDGNIYFLFLRPLFKLLVAGTKGMCVHNKDWKVKEKKTFTQLLLNYSRLRYPQHISGLNPSASEPTYLNITRGIKTNSCLVRISLALKTHTHTRRIIMLIYEVMVNPEIAGTCDNLCKQ